MPNAKKIFFPYVSSLSLFLQALGIYLLWRSPSEGVNVSLEVTVTLLNRENFKDNRTFTIRRAGYRHGFLSNGNRAFITIADILTHRPRYLDQNGEFQIELKLSRAETYFEKDFYFPKNISPKGEADSSEENVNNLVQVSNEFTYGAFIWSLTVRPQMLLTWSRQNDPGLNIVLSRKFRAQSQSLLCRICYVFSAGVGENRRCSQRRDEMVGTNESTQPWSPKGARLQDFYIRQIRDGGLLRVRLDLESARPMTDFVMCPSPPSPTSDNNTAGGGGGEGTTGLINKKVLNKENSLMGPAATPGTVLGLDPDGANWAMEADLHSGFLRFSLFYLDITKIPRNHLRYAK